MQHGYWLEQRHTYMYIYVILTLFRDYMYCIRPVETLTPNLDPGFRLVTQARGVDIDIWM